ncbi:hypothetical protein AN644_04145 [Candidatus Epulonipiscium fishelsonii]|nr:hypothetical protein AN644_04145 [Epulopiscium sp. SCG-C06WGA-EpuloA1]
MSTVIFWTTAYNNEQTIERTYKSLCNQTDANWMWHVVDDASTDMTYEILCNLARQDTRIIVKRNKINRDYAPGSNIWEVAQLYSDDDYLAIIDGDDEYENKFIEICKNYGKEHNLDIIIGGNKFIDAKTCEITFIRSLEAPMLILNKKDKLDYFYAYYQFMRTYWGKLFKIGIIKNTNSKNIDIKPIYGYSWDTAFCIKQFSYANRIGIINESFYKFFRSNDAQSYKFYEGRIESDQKLFELGENYLMECNAGVSDKKTLFNQQVLEIIYFQSIKSSLQVIINCDLSSHEKHLKILKIGKSKYTQSILLNENLGNLIVQYHNNNFWIKQRMLLFQDLAKWMLNATSIEDEIILDYCVIGQLFCATSGYEEGWIKFKNLHSNTLIELGDKMIIQGKNELQELEKYYFNN